MPPPRWHPRCRCSTLRIAITSLVLLTWSLYMLVYGVKRGFFEPNVQDKIMVIHSTDFQLFGLSRRQGMFVEAQTALGAIAYALDNRAAGVDFIYDNKWFTDPARGPNWLDYYFLTSTVTLNPHAPPRPREVHYTGYLSRYGVLDSFNSYIAKYDLPVHMAYNPYCRYSVPVRTAIPLERLRYIARTHMPPKPTLVADARAFIANNTRDAAMVIGIHYRGTDRTSNYPYYTIPFALVAWAVDRVIARRAPPGRNVGIFIASDSHAFHDYAAARWPGRTFYRHRNPAAGAIHFNPDIAPLAKGDAGIQDMLALAATDYLVKVRSTLSNTALYYSDRLDYTFILSAHDPVYSNREDIGQPDDALLRRLRTQHSLIGTPMSAATRHLCPAGFDSDNRAPSQWAVRDAISHIGQ